MFFVHRVLNSVTMMYNEADELTACHFIRPSTYFKPAAPAQDEEQADDSSDSKVPPSLDKEEPL